MKLAQFLSAMIVCMVLNIAFVQTNARNNDNLIYNSTEENGQVVEETVYKNNEGQLVNFMKYAYTRDAEGRVLTQENLKWINGAWTKTVALHYSYAGKQMTTTYHKWNNKTQAYVIVPEMTMTVDQ